MYHSNGGGNFPAYQLPPPQHLANHEISCLSPPLPPLKPTSNPSKRHRERLNAELDTVGSLLPFTEPVIAKLDKLSILRLAVSYLQVKSHFQALLQRHTINDSYTLYDSAHFGVEATIFQALHGFILIINENGEIYFATENIENFLGFHQSDILHQPVFDLLHSDDRQNFREQLLYRIPKHTPAKIINYEPLLLRDFTARFRCLLDNTCGFMRFKLEGYLSVLFGIPACYASSRVDPDLPVVGLVVLCIPLTPPLSLEPCETPPILLKSKHNLNYDFVSMDIKLRDLLNIKYQMPKSFYAMIHSDDLEYFGQLHKEVTKTGASNVLVYRIYVITDGKEKRWCWLQTYARLLYRNAKPDSIACTHRILTETEGVRLLDKRSLMTAASWNFEESTLPRYSNPLMTFLPPMPSASKKSKRGAKAEKTSQKCNSSASKISAPIPIEIQAPAYNPYISPPVYQPYALESGIYCHAGPKLPTTPVYQQSYSVTHTWYTVPSPVPNANTNAIGAADLMECSPYCAPVGCQPQQQSSVKIYQQI